MNRKMFLLTVADACGWMAQAAGTRFAAQVPFPFDFAGKPMASCKHEMLRDGAFRRITIRNLENGAAAAILSVGLATAQVFEKGQASGRVSPNALRARRGSQ